MKIKYFASLLLFLICAYRNSIFAQDPWKRVTPVYGNETFVSVHFRDSLRGVALNRNMGSFRSWDGGKSWIPGEQKIGISTDDFQVEYPTADFGYRFHGVPWARVLEKSSNGGESWSQISGPANEGVTKLTFTSQNIGFVTTNNTGFNPWKVFQTTDGGSSWIFKGQSTQILHLKAVSPTELYAIRNSGTREVSRSTDGGATWQTIYELFNETPSGFYFQNPQHGYVFLFNRVIETTNSGVTWNQVQDLAALSPLKSLKFFSQNVGYALGNSNRIAKTTDGGQTWTLLPKVFSLAVRDLNFVSPQKGFVFGLIGTLETTLDGGQTWSVLQEDHVSQFESIAAQTTTRAWVVGQKSGFKNHILRTDDRGKTWQDVTFDSTARFRKVLFLSPQKGFLVGFPNSYRTENGGRTWNPIPGGKDVCFIHPDTGFILSTGFNFSRTYDGGQTWTFIQNSAFSQSEKIQFLNSKIGFLLGGLGGGPMGTFLYKTTNGGQSWIEMSEGNPQLFGYYPNSMFFLDSLRGWVGQLAGGIFRTTNGGKSWVSGTGGGGPKQIWFKDSLNGFAATTGAIAKTQDGGLNWVLMDGVYGEAFCSGFHIENGEPVLACAHGGEIYIRGSWRKEDDFQVKGRVVQRKVQGCILDSVETSLPGRIFVAEPGAVYSISDDRGEYFLELDSGSYSIQQLVPSFGAAKLESQICPPSEGSHSVSVLPSNFFESGKDFKNEVKNCPVLRIVQTHFPKRPCRRSTILFSIENLGNIASDSEIVVLEVPDSLFIVESSIPYSINPVTRICSLKIPPIQTYGLFRFWLVDSVACSPAALTGQTLCIKATIPNVPPCLLQSPGWDGSDLEVASRCLANTNQTRFTIRNKGAAMSQTAQYRIYIDSALVYQAPFQLAANNTMSVTLPANAPAGFARLVVPQSANHPLSTFASAEANCATGLSTNGLFPPPDESPLVDIECVTVTNAYDPNDKLVYPRGWGSNGNVEPGTEFKYTIRFQNTGTDTAFKVVLVDTLDANLDIASFQLGNASHNYNFKVSGKGRPVLTWTFDNILLPDSGRNQEASNGFVNFSVRPKATAAVGTRLENFADIYFDFNDPIRTNTTVNTLWVPTLDPGVLDTVFTAAQKPLVLARFQIQPNPSSGQVEVNASDAGVLQILDLRGVQMEAFSIGKGKSQILLNHLPRGILLIRFKTEQGVISDKLFLE